jgi:quinol monooxygenase YgiN
MLKFIATIEAKPGHETLVTEGLRDLIAPSRAEAGCTLYDACRAKDNPARLLVLEEWESQTALDAHIATPHFEAFLAKVGDALTGPPNLEIIERI